MPIAVGTTLMDSEKALSGKGKLLELCHTYGDMLWAAAGRTVPNEGFLADGVVGLGCSMDDDMAVYDGDASDDSDAGACETPKHALALPLPCRRGG
jgi:hypothetical protein